MLRITAGDSYWKDYISPQVPTFDSNWSASYVIVASLGSVASATGTIDKSLDQSSWEVRVPGTHTAQTPGDYFLVVQFKNTLTGFCKEITEPMQISVGSIA
jgi:hypothetical protein